MRIRQIEKILNRTEIGSSETNTNDAYVRFPNDSKVLEWYGVNDAQPGWQHLLDIVFMDDGSIIKTKKKNGFVKFVYATTNSKSDRNVSDTESDIEDSVDISQSQTQVSVNSQSKGEFRLSGLAKFFEDNGVVPGDRLILKEVVTENESPKYYAQLIKNKNTIFFHKYSGYFGCYNKSRISLLFPTKQISTAIIDMGESENITDEHAENSPLESMSLDVLYMGNLHKLVISHSFQKKQYRKQLIDPYSFTLDGTNINWTDLLLNQTCRGWELINLANNTYKAMEFEI